MADVVKIEFTYDGYYDVEKEKSYGDEVAKVLENEFQEDEIEE